MWKRGKKRRKREREKGERGRKGESEKRIRKRAKEDACVEKEEARVEKMGGGGEREEKRRGREKVEKDGANS